MRAQALLIAILIVLVVNGQGNWSWQPLAPMPLPTANNAVCAAVVNGDQRVYSFGGITAGLALSNIHQEAFIYSSATGSWTTLPQVPDTSGKIASAASVVNGIAYVIGGYHVFANAPFERSSDRVHRLDLATNSWLSDGAPLPIPIDDQVQAVWHDSLIYVVTGWSQNANVSAVQIYDPALDQWSVGTPVPSSNAYKAFGASGTIINDTIYYYGGAISSGNFNAQDDLRIGVIDPQDPTQITWAPAISTLRNSYRSGCGTINGVPFWVGGSAISYNYDAVAYNGSGVVSPVAEVAAFNGTALSTFASEQAVMDIRGIGQRTDGAFHVCGGIGANAEVLSSHWLVQPTVSVPEHGPASMRIYPNPSNGWVHIVGDIISDKAQVEVHDPSGRIVFRTVMTQLPIDLDLTGMAPGTYVLKLLSGTSVTMFRFWLVN